MSNISPTNINDGDDVTAASVNNQINTIVNDYNGNVDNTNIKSGANISGAKLADGTVTNAKLDSTAGAAGGAWATFTPTWTGSSSNPAIGNGTLTGMYQQVGKTVFYRIKMYAGSTTTNGTGVWYFTPPITPNAFYSDTNGVMAVGTWSETISSSYSGVTVLRLISGTIVLDNLVGVNPVAAEMGAAQPTTQTTSSKLIMSGTYEAA